MLWHAQAGVAELADALDLGSSVERRRGSSPLSRTKLLILRWQLGPLTQPAQAARICA